MKFKGREHAVWDEEAFDVAFEAALASAENEREREAGNQRPAKNLKSDHIKASAWMKLLHPAIEKMSEENRTMWPLMQTIKGSKTRIQFDTYSETAQDMEQIFDNFSHIFRSKAQLNALAHYIGTNILQHKLIVLGGKGISRFSQRLKDHEQKRNFHGELSKLHDEIKLSIDHFYAGIIDEKDLEEDMQDYVKCFNNPEDQKVAERFLSTLLETGEMERGRARMGMRKSRATKLELVK